MSKTLAFDGDCPMCGWIAERFGEVGLADAAHRRPYQSFEGETARRMEEAGIRNEMLVLDEATGELRSGIEGFLWLLEGTRWSWAAPLLSLPPVRGTMRLIYRTIAYNRRVLAPPPSGIVCACDPDPHPGYRALLLLSLALVCLAGAGLFGWALSALHPTLRWPAPAMGAALVMALPFALFGWLSPRRLSEVPGHCLVAMAGAVLVAAPFLVLSSLGRGWWATSLVALGVTLGGWRFLTSALRRLRPGGVRRASGLGANGT